MKKLKNSIPEIYLVISGLFYWLSSSFLNPIAIILIVVFCYQLVTKKINSGIVIASLFILINLYLVLALISEANKSDIINDNWKQLVIVGSLYIGTNLIMGFVMLFKYIKLKNETQVLSTQN